MIDWHDKYLNEFYEVVPNMVASGQLQCFDHLCHGLEDAGRGFVDMMTGKNVGKTTIIVSDE